MNAIILGLTVLALGVEGRPGDEQGLDSAVLSRLIANESGVVCGVNALFVYLRCRGGAVDYEAIRMHVREGALGLTMEQMKSICAQAASPAIVLRGSISTIDSSMLPVIGLITADKASQSNHFIVVMERQGRRLQIMDGTSGRVHNVRQQWLVDRERGAYLCPAQGAESILIKPLDRVLLAVAAVISLLGVALVRRKSFRRYGVIYTTIFCFSTLGLVNQAVGSSDSGDSVLGTGACGATQWEPSIAEFSRCPGYDAANIGALMLRLYEIESPYQEIWNWFYAKERPAASLLDMKLFMERQGVSCRIIRCSPESIDARWLPAITLVADPVQPSIYEMSLLCTASGDSSCVVGGGSASVRLISGEEFRRTWSGVLLVMDFRKPLKFGSAGIGVLGVTLGVLAGSCLLNVGRPLPSAGRGGAYESN